MIQQWLVVGVHGDWQRVTVVPAGNVIGPIGEGQVVRLRPDEPNRRKQDPGNRLDSDGPPA